MQVLNTPAENKPDDLPIESELLVDVYFSESDLEKVISKRYGAAEAQRLKEKPK